jgi:hypothetical protein
MLVPMTFRIYPLLELAAEENKTSAEALDVAGVVSEAVDYKAVMLGKISHQMQSSIPGALG